MDNIGIYCIYFHDIDNKYYIGYSSNLYERTQNHISALKAKRHINKSLQNAYNSYGEPVIEVLEFCKLEELSLKEIYWIEQFDSFKNGFNQTLGGDGGGFGEGVHNALYTKEKYIEMLKAIINRNNRSLKDIAIELNVKLEVLKHISSLSAHSWLEEEYPEEYKKLRSLKGKKDNSAKSLGIKYPSIICPEGIVHSNIHNLTEFCRIHNLQPQNMHKVLTKTRPSHKGWKLYNASNN